MKLTSNKFDVLYEALDSLYEAVDNAEDTSITEAEGDTEKAKLTREELDWSDKDIADVLASEELDKKIIECGNVDPEYGSEISWHSFLAKVITIKCKDDYEIKIELHTNSPTWGGYHTVNNIKVTVGCYESKDYARYICSESFDMEPGDNISAELNRWESKAVDKIDEYLVDRKKREEEGRKYKEERAAEEARRQREIEARKRDSIFDVLDKDLKALPEPKDRETHERWEYDCQKESLNVYLSYYPAFTTKDGKTIDSYYTLFVIVDGIRLNLPQLTDAIKTQEDLDRAKELIRNKVKQALDSNDRDSLTALADRVYNRLCDEECTIYYPSIEVSYAYGRRSWEDGSYEHEGTTDVEWEYTGASVGEVCESVIQEHWEDFMPEGTTGDEPDFEDKLWTKMEEDFDDLFEKYEKEIQDYYRDSAEEDAREHADVNTEPDWDDQDD